MQSRFLIQKIVVVYATDSKRGKESNFRSNFYDQG